MMQYFHAKNAAIELTRISNALHARIDMLHNCVSDSLHSLVQEYYQIVMEDGNPIVNTDSPLTLHGAPEPPRRSSVMTTSLPHFVDEDQQDTSNIKNIKTLRRQTRVLSVILPQQQAIEDMQLPTDDGHSNTDSIETELSQVKARLAELEELFNRDSIMIDSALVDEMVVLQHRALDLMKTLYAREREVAVDYDKMDISNMDGLERGAASFDPQIKSVDVSSEAKVQIISANVVSSSTVNTDGSKYTVYNIEVINSIGQQWRISRRFNEFYLLDVQIRKNMSGASYDGKALDEMPKLPPKTLYNMTEAVVTARLEALHQYVSCMLQHPLLSQVESFVSFLQPSAETTIHNKPFS
eukprot:TRINITY_DN6714_c0_g3_i3.p1 TRINITY_DN6714_c0_g3~~TRINITY_DN6714_c0_g3_i3.p1  ORF type:complete len:354 (+),score=73.80 TRINITY_DN6714_c0_g3_i3:501-1562(+)